MASNTIEIKITAENSQAIAALKQLADAAKQAAGNTNSAGKGAGQGFDESASAIQSDGNKIVSVLNQISSTVTSVANIFGVAGASSSNALQEVANEAKAAGDEIVRTNERVAASEKTNKSNFPGTQPVVPQSSIPSKVPTQPVPQSSTPSSSFGSSFFSGAIASGETFLGKLGQIGMAAVGLKTTFETVAGVVKQAFGPGIDFNRQMETSQLGIAGIITSMETTNGQAVQFNDAMAVAGKVMNQLQQDAAKIGLPLRDMTTAFQSIVGPALQARMTMDQAEKFTVTGTKAVKTMMGPQANDMQITQELRSMVSGNIDQDSQVARAMGITNEQVNAAKQSAGGLFDYLMDRLSGFQAVAERYPSTFNGTIERFDTMFQQAEGSAVKPFMDSFKNGLNDIISKLFEVNQATGKIEFNSNIVSVINTIKTALDELKPVFNAMASNASIIFDVFKPVLSALKDLFLALLPPIASVITVINQINQAVAPAFKAVTEEISTAIHYLIDNLNTLITVVEKVAIGFGVAKGALMAYDAAVLIVSKRAIFAEIATKAWEAGKAILSMKKATELLGLAMGKLNKKNIVFALLAAGGVVFSDKIMEWAEKLGNWISGNSGGSSDLDNKRGDRNWSPLDDNPNPGNPDIPLEPKYNDPDKDQYEKASQAVDAAISQLNYDIDASKALIQKQIDTINSKANGEGRSLTPDEHVQVTQLQKQLQEAEVERYIKQKGIIEGVLSPADTESKHTDEIAKKSTDAANKARDAQTKVDDLAQALKSMGVAATAAANNAADFGQKVIGIGEDFLGTPYVEGGVGQKIATDCGQLVKDVFSQAGYEFERRTADAQYLQLEQQGRIFNDKSQLKPGDLIFYYTGGYTPSDDPDAVNSGSEAYKGTTHVAIYEGNDKVLHASSGQGQVIENANAWDMGPGSYVTGFGRTSDLGGGRETSANFGNNQIYNATSFSQELAEYIKSVKELMQKQEDIAGMHDEIKGKTTTKAYNDIDRQYQPYINAFSAAGPAYKGDLDKTVQLVGILKNRADYSQAQKSLELANGQLTEAQETLMSDLATGSKTAAQVTDDYITQYHAKTGKIVAKLQGIISTAGDDIELSNEAKSLLRQIAKGVSDFADNVIKRIDAELQNEIAKINANRSMTKMQKDDAIDAATRRAYADKAVEQETKAKELQNIDLVNGNNKNAVSIIDNQNAANLNRQLAQMPSLLDKIHEASKQAFEDGLLSFLTDGILKCKSLGEAFADLATSVLQSIRKIYAQDLTKQIMIGMGLGPKSGNAWTLSDGTQLDPNFGFKFADGGSMNNGQIKGPGTSTSDSILAWVGNLRKFVKLSDGEYVVKTAAVKKYGTDFMERLNNGLIPAGFSDIKAQFAAGGTLSDQILPGPQDIATSLVSGDTNIHLKNVNVFDPNDIGRYLESRSGEKVLINWLKNRSNVTRQVLRI